MGPLKMSQIHDIKEEKTQLLWLEHSQLSGRTGPTGIQIEGTLPAVCSECAQGLCGKLGSGWKPLYSSLVMKDVTEAQGDGRLPAWVTFGAELSVLLESREYAGWMSVPLPQVRE